MSYRITIPGIPIAKGRPRVRAFHGKVQTYTPKKTAQYENLVRLAAAEICSSLLEGPLSVLIVAYWPMRGQPRKTNPRPAILKTTRPDVDNLAKSVLDGLQGVAFNDDAQVVDLRAIKWHAAQGDGPRVEVEVREVK